MKDIKAVSTDVMALSEDTPDIDTDETYLSTLCYALDVVGDGVLVTSLEGRIIYANLVIMAMCGRDRGEVIGRKIKDLFAGEDADLAGFLKVVGDIGEWRGEIVVHCGNSSKKSTLKVLTHPIQDDTGYVIGSVTSFTDVTYQRQLEERLTHYEPLAILCQLTGGVAHELRNALGLIKGAVHFLNESLDNLSAEAAKVLGLLNSGVEKSDQIIKSLLTVARPTPSSWREVDVNKVVRVALAGASIPENVRVITHLSGALSEIMGDGGQINLVLDNLIRNALQAMPNGGKLKVTTEAPDDKWVVVSVADTGSGISEADQRRLFDPLFTKKSGGIGLGLALVRSLTEGHGGHVELESEVGKGSVFSIHLRRDAKPARPGV